MANTVQSPRMPEVARITDIEQLLPIAREMVSRKAVNLYEGMKIFKGQRVLIVNDATADQLVVEALAAAIREKGAHLTIINLEGFTDLKDSVELLDNTFSNNWYPKWVWDAANEVDIVLQTAYMKSPHTPIHKLANNPIVKGLELTADLMASEYETFPVEVRDAIDAVAWENLEDSTRIKWTDPEGTDLEINLTKEEWHNIVSFETEKRGKHFKPGHLNVPVAQTTRAAGINGVLVSSSITFGGPIPRVSLTIEKGRVVKVEGGGKFGDGLQESFERYTGRYPTVAGRTYPAHGINWLYTVGICTNPKARRSPFFDELSGSARISAWTFGHRRSGVIHSSIGEGMVSPGYAVIRHLDTYFNTIVTDKGPVIENGHLLALDDPRVREVASRYGDPDELLRESWIPAVAGVNI